MQKRKKLAVIGTLLIVLVAGGIVWQVVDVNRTGRSPVSALFKNEGQEASSNEPSADPVTIVLREEVPTPTPTPSPTPSPTPTSAPTPTSTPTSAPAESVKNRKYFRFSTESRPSGSQAGNQNTAEEPKPTPKPTPKVTPTPRPQVIEATPEPTPVPEVAKISRLIHTASIFCPETAGASTLPQHLVIFTAWARSGVQQLRCCLSFRFRYFRRHHHGRKHRLGHRHRV